MKKIFTLIACVFFAMSAFAQEDEKGETEATYIRIPWGPIYRSVLGPQITAYQTENAIDFSVDETLGAAQVVVYDQSGAEVQSDYYDITANTVYSVSIASLMPGQYVIYLFLSEYNPSCFRGCFEVK